MRRREALPEYEEQPDEPSCELVLHVLRIGELPTATNPFKLSLDYGLRMKTRSRAQRTVVVQLACDRYRYPAMA